MRAAVDEAGRIRRFRALRGDIQAAADRLETGYTQFKIFHPEP